MLSDLFQEFSVLIMKVGEENMIKISNHVIGRGLIPVDIGKPKQ